MIRTFLIRRDGLTKEGPVLPERKPYFEQYELGPIKTSYMVDPNEIPQPLGYRRTFRYVGEAGPYHVYGEV